MPALKHFPYLVSCNAPNIPMGTASWACGMCSLTRQQALEGPTIGLMLCCRHLEYLIVFGKEALHFHFALGSTKYILSVRYYLYLTKGFFTARLLSIFKIEIHIVDIQVWDIVCNISQTYLTLGDYFFMENLLEVLCSAEHRLKPNPLVIWFPPSPAPDSLSTVSSFLLLCLPYALQSGLAH